MGRAVFFIGFNTINTQSIRPHRTEYENDTSRTEIKTGPQRRVISFRHQQSHSLSSLHCTHTPRHHRACDGEAHLVSMGSGTIQQLERKHPRMAKRCPTPSLYFFDWLSLASTRRGRGAGLVNGRVASKYYWRKRLDRSAVCAAAPQLVTAGPVELSSMAASIAAGAPASLRHRHRSAQTSAAAPYVKHTQAYGEAGGSGVVHLNAATLED